MESRQVKYPLGSLSGIEAKTFGEPGQRTFQLVLDAGRARCIVWLEKELLFQLGGRLQEAAEQLGYEARERPGRAVDDEWSGRELSLDFKIGQLSLEYDNENSSFRLAAYEIEEAEESNEEVTSVSFLITVDQAATLAEEALRICSAGRPRCFLCGLPINPDGHVCPRSNGHVVLEPGELPA